MPPPRSRPSSRPPPAHSKGPGQSTSRDWGTSPTATRNAPGRKPAHPGSILHPRPYRAGIRGRQGPSRQARRSAGRAPRSGGSRTAAATGPAIAARLRLPRRGRWRRCRCRLSLDCYRDVGLSRRLWQVEDGRNLIYSPHVRKCAQTTRGHWMPAVSPLLIEGDENWFRRQPYSRVRKPHTAAVSAALTPHIVQEPCSRVDDPPRSHRRRVPTRTTLPTHLRSVDSSARSFTSFQPVRLHPWPLDSRSAEGWVMRGAW